MAAMKDKAGGWKTVCVRLDGMAVDLSAADPAKLPRRMKVLNWGENRNARNKRVFVGRKLQAALNAPTYPFRKIPLDFEHNTLPGTPAYKESKEPRQVAGFAGVEAVEGEGVFITMLNWTPEGVANAANYCDLSASPVTDKDGEVVAMPSVGLCRCGAVEGMDFAEFALSAETTAALNAITQNTTTEVDELNWKEMICKALGLDAATTSDDDVAAKLAAALKPVDVTALNASIAEAVKPLQAEIDALKAGHKDGTDDRVTALSVEVGAFKAELEKRDKQAVLDRARGDGKVVALSAEAVQKLSVADLQAHVDALAVTVPLSARTPGAMKPETGSDAGPDEQQRAIALNCGLDPDSVWPAKK